MAAIGPGFDRRRILDLKSFDCAGNAVFVVGRFLQVSKEP
jgi:hypothetical protein